MAERRAWQASVGSLVFLVVVPGTVAGWVPYWLTRWHPGPPLVGVPSSRAVGWILVVVGVASLVESVLRFALVGLGTPAPVAAPSRLVVSVRGVVRGVSPERETLVATGDPVAGMMQPGGGKPGVYEPRHARPRWSKARTSRGAGRARGRR